uniref:Uncharacterized protein n=1 Tax=viral metagenome TaxID=1070528 RepID=A0A6M3M4J0_9ZZZZ
MADDPTSDDTLGLHPLYPTVLDHDFQEISDGEIQAKRKGRQSEYVLERVTRQITELSTERKAHTEAMTHVERSLSLMEQQVSASVASLNASAATYQSAADALERERERMQAEPWRYRIVSRVAMAFERHPWAFIVALGMAGLVAYLLGVNVSGWWSPVP